MPDYDITISYKGSTIATMSSSGTKTLETAGTYCEDDIIIDYTKTGITVVETLDPNGGTIVSISGDPVTSLQAKTVIPTSQSQTISADSGYDAISEVLVQGDSNLIGSNIASGVSIFGVVGTFAGSGGTGWETAPESWVEALNRKTISEAYGSMVTRIRTYAFEQCTSLITVSFPNCSIIEDWAFYTCASLTTAYFPNCTSIGKSAFYACHDLNTITFSNCDQISYCAFMNNWKLTEASFPNCTVIGSQAFQSCSSLITAYFPKCATLQSSVFYKCSKLETIFFPECVWIQGFDFYGCSNLTEASFPKCTYIGTSVFYTCYNLTSIYFPNCISIYSYAFCSCTSLSMVSFPRCVNIGSYAFTGCTNLLVASFPNCTTIGASAFTYCTALKSLYILTERVPILANTALNNTPISNSTYLGYYGSIYVLSRFLDNFKKAAVWSLYSDRFVGVEG